ncbi:MAG: redoxin domain-containing protein [Acidobacteriota bacterium]|nr:MAG: redoxin domain-containing protein [Acidobacteriota bacterium]
MEQLLPRFRDAHTQVLGISVDSIFCHANWAESLGGISFPLLADFHPKGAVTRSYGLYLEDAGITDRATVIVDASGFVRHASSVTPAGRRNIAELAALCEAVDKEHGAALAKILAPRGLGKVEALFVKSNCGFSRKVMLARENLHLQPQVPLRNVSENPAAHEQLIRLTGKDQVPCLVVGGESIQDSDDIVRYLVSRASDLD